MAAIQSLPELLQILTSSLSTLSSTLPTIESLKPPTDGISLLDTKNELLLTYLQNLVFLILLKLRNTRAQIDNTDADDDADIESQRIVADEVVKKLVELRVYLERGVKPLESKLRYQIDKAVRTADDHATRNSQRRREDANGMSNGKRSKKSTIGAENSGKDSSNSDEDESAGSDSASQNNEIISQANLSAFTRPSHAQDRSNGSGRDKNSNGVYRPPRIAPVAPPTSEAKLQQQQQQQKQGRRPAKSHLLDEYIGSELSGAPIGEPSIGANILDRGRGDIMSTRERREAADRQRYEEENLVRLPGMGKKERQKMRGEREKRGQFGGEEWNELGGSADRIAQLTRRGIASGGVRNALERSRKRGREEVSQGHGNTGAEIGERFERKRRQLENRTNRRR